MTRRDAGFSLVEVLVAIVILSIGLLALAQSSGTVTTMIGRGQQDTEAAALAQSRLDRLRQDAVDTSPKCTSLSSGTATSGTSTVTWTVSGSGDSRTVMVIVNYRIGGGRGTRTDTVRAVLGCL